MGTFSWALVRDSLLDELDEGVCVFDEQFKLVTWNQALQRLLELPAGMLSEQVEFTDILTYCAERGDLGPGDSGLLCLNLLEALETAQRACNPIRLNGPTELFLRVQPMERGLTLARFTPPELFEATATPAQKEAGFRELLDQNAAPVVVHRDERILFANKALSAQAGLPVELFVGRKVTDFLPEEELANYESRRDQGEIGLWEVEYRLPDGSTRWAETANAEIDWDGSPAMQVTFLDVTARKQAELELERQALVMQQITEGVIISDNADTIIDCNASACSILRLEKADLVGKPGTVLVPEGTDRDEIYAQVRESLESQGTWFGELTFHNDDRPNQHLEISVSSRRGPDGETLGRISIFRDVTQRREVEQAAEQTEAKFRNLIDGSLHGILIHRDGGIVYVNRTTAELFATQSHSMLGRPVEDFIHPESADQRAAFLEGEIGEPIKVRATRDDGATIWLEVNARAVDWDGEPARQVMINDITQRQRAEDALLHAQKLESLGQLTGGIAHDFNNLLGVISGNLELLREQLAESEDQAMFIEASLRSVRRGAELTQRLLAFSRKTPLKPQLMDINTLVRTMTGMLQRTLGETIAIDTHLTESPWSVSVDPGQMENSLLNLALNARDAMPRGGQLVVETQNISLSSDLIRRTTAVPAGEYLRVSVRDTGTGMPAEVLENAFQPFFTTKEVGAGSGLGLSMVYGFVQQSSGHIHIDSAPGRGATIHLYLPRSMEQIQAPESIQPGGPGPSGNKEVVLVVEDDEDLRRLSVVLLNRMGYRTMEAADGPNALALLAKLDHIDLLFTDLVLPGGMGGFEIAKAAKAQFPKIKVLFTSGYSESDAFREAFEDGKAELIPKPYRKDALAKRLQEVLQS